MTRLDDTIRAFPPDPDTGDWTDPEREILEDAAGFWFTNWENMILLAGWMADRGGTGREVAAMIAKPWEYTDEFLRAYWEQLENVGLA